MNVTDSHLARAADDDLVDAERLAAVVGMQVTHVAALREQLAAGHDVVAVAEEAKAVRTSLQAAAAQRAALLERWASLPSRLDELDELEHSVRLLVDRSRAEVTAPPPLTVPSVAAVRHAVVDESAAATGDLSWPALRGRLSPLVVSVDRLAATLHDLAERCNTLLAGDTGDDGAAG